MTLAVILKDLHAVGDMIFIVSVGGAGFCFVTGALRSSSKGCRLAGGVQAVSTNKRRVCRWAAWSGVMLAIEIGMEHVRAPGPLNTAVACGAASALFSVHRGTRAAVRSGLKGATYGGVAGIAIYSIIRFVESVESSD